MYLQRSIRKKKDAPPADLPFGLKIKARAWTTGSTINVVIGNEGNGTLLAHEAAHAIRDQTNDEMHHPWWHFCGLVGHAIRIWPRGRFCVALTDLEVRAGGQLAVFGDCDLSALQAAVARGA